MQSVGILPRTRAEAVSALKAALAQPEVRALVDGAGKAAEFQQFVDAIESGPPPSVSTIQALYVLEGFDGSGKTTVAQNLVRRLGDAAVLFGTPALKLAPLRRIFDKLPENTRRLFYIAANYFAMDWLACSPKVAGKIVICDRFYCSTIAYHFAHADEVPAAGSDLHAWPADLVPRPTASVMLTLSEEKRAARVVARSQIPATTTAAVATAVTDEETRLARDVRFRAKLAEAYRRCPDLVAVDADGDPADVCERVFQALQISAP